MRRINLVLDKQLLDEVKRLSGARTYSDAVQQALRDFARRFRSRRILDLRGCGLWQGNLAEMRRDSTKRN